jgi:basic amino acid/polyamine antiporter, APA family
MIAEVAGDVGSWWRRPSTVCITIPAVNEQLRRELGLGSAVMLGLGAMIGTGVFVSIGIAAGLAGEAVVLAIVIAAIVAACNALSSAQLAASHPVSGGTYEYGYRYLTPVLGFSAGWMFLVAKTGSAAAAALGFSGYLCRLVGIDAGRFLVPIAVWTVVAMTALVVTGAKRSSAANAAIVAVTLVALGALVVTGIPVVLRETSAATSSSILPDNAGAFLEAAALMFVAFTGYGRVATLGEEVREPRRTIPVAIMVTVVVSAILYLAVAWMSVRAVGPEALAASVDRDAAPLEAVALVFGGRWLERLVALGAVTAMAGVLLNLILGLSRVVLAMARRGDAPAPLAVLSGGGRSPDRAVILVGLAIAALALVFSVRSNWSLSAFTVLIYYSLTNLASLRLKEGERLYPLSVSVTGLVGCVALAAFVDPRAMVGGLAVLAAGVTGRALLRRKADAQE